MPAVAEPPELFQLKCASHRYTADTNSTHFKWNNPLVCWVTARYNHGSTGSKQVYLARRRVYNRTTAHQLLIHRILNIITSVSNLSILIQHCLKTTSYASLCRVTTEEINTRLHTSRRLTPSSAQNMVSFRRVTASRGWILSVFNRLPTVGYTQGGKFWVKERRDQELEGARSTKL
jgi:hypothetical protein